MFVVVFMSFFFFKQKTAYEMRISDWSSDVCSSDLDPCGIPSPACDLDPSAPRQQLRGGGRQGCAGDATALPPRGGRANFAAHAKIDLPRPQDRTSVV